MKKGVEEYRSDDALNMPESDFDLEGIKKGCEQLIQCRGFEIDKPLGLGVFCLSDMMMTFHFRKVERQSIHQENDDILDKLVYQHVIHDSTIVLYNLVHY